MPGFVNGTLTDMVRAVAANKGMYQLWLSNDHENVRFPIPWLPESYDISEGSNHTTVDIIGLGELMVLQNRPLMEFSFSSRFPARTQPGGSHFEPQAPSDYKTAMLGLKRSQWPCHVLITGTDVNFYCVITDLSFTERGGDVGTLYYDVTFREWREVTPRQVEVDPITQIAIVPINVGTRPDNRKTPATYQVKEGDSPRSIAKKLFGDETRWRELYDLNREQIPHPLLAQPGSVIQVPQ